MHPSLVLIATAVDLRKRHRHTAGEVGGKGERKRGKEEGRGRESEGVSSGVHACTSPNSPPHPPCRQLPFLCWTLLSEI